MAKKLKVEHDQSDGYNYFQNLADQLVISIFTKLCKVAATGNMTLMLSRCLSVCKRCNALASIVPVLSNTCFQNLPDEIVICIFTKLSSCSNEKHDSFDDLKALGRCSNISKRFNSLVSLVPTLSIKHPTIFMLYVYWPLILNKFKYIRFLQITHWSSIAKLMRDQNKCIPLIVWEASYRPHSCCLAVVSYKNVFSYSNQDPQSFMLSDDTPKDDQYHNSIWSHIKDMFCLHHLLVSSIKDHTFLQRAVVTDLYARGTLILEKDTIAELRNCTTTNLEHVLVRDRSGSAINLDVPSPIKHLGLMLNDVFFSIIEWREKPMHDPIPTDLQNVWLVRLLGILLEDPAK